MDSYRAALTAALAQLRAAGVDDAARDAARLLAHVADVPAHHVRLNPDARLNPAQQAAYGDAIARRAAREPVSQIIGRREFWGRDFLVGPDVLDPRPETECLVEVALGTTFDHVLDLGTGSGCILLTLLAERPQATGVGVEAAPGALVMARRNADALGLATRARLLPGDWYAGLGGELFDLIVSNPPYIAADEMAALAPELAYEPRIALTDEADGLTAYRAIAGGARAHLHPGGWLMVEIGHRQGAAVQALFRDAGLENTAIRPDLDSRDRVVIGQAPG